MFFEDIRCSMFKIVAVGSFSLQLGHYVVIKLTFVKTKIYMFVQQLGLILTKAYNQ